MPFFRPTALALAEISAAEYFDDIGAALRNTKAALGEFDVVHSNRGSECEYSILRVAGGGPFGPDPGQVLVFRGTEPTNLCDWMTDARIYRRRWAGTGRVHRGFADEVDAELPRIRAALRPNLPVFSTGHSKGAGDATYATAWQLRSGYEVAGLYTYGSPRVFNRRGAEALDAALGDRFWRVVNNNDIVTRVPVTAIWRGYWHAGRLAYIEADGALVFEPSRWRRFRDRVRGRMQALRGGEPTVAEVPGLPGKVVKRLEAAGHAKLSQILSVSVAELAASVVGLGPAGAAAIAAWAVHRSQGWHLAAGAFDGTADHSITRYVGALRS
jgi:hypothetical protein